MIYLHIGTHKTGSKSLQRFLFDHSAELAERGFDLYSGYHQNPTNHRELLTASLRPGRDSFPTFNEPERTEDGGYYAKIAAHVHKFLESAKHPHQIFSSEDLSHLRFPDEFARLKTLLKIPPSEIRVIVYLRKKEEYRRSYLQQIERRKGRTASDDPDSVFYLGEDSWLFDYDQLINRWREQLGSEVVAIDYDLETAASGNIIPSFMKALDVSTDALPWEGYFLHRSDSAIEVKDYRQAVRLPPAESVPPGSLIFIVGPRRSGTTLLNNILCADPRANPQIGEAQPLTQLLGAFAWSASNYERMTRHYFPTPDALDDFAADTCRSLLARCWDTQGRPHHLILKNPELSNHIDTVMRYFPSARFVVCVRDPRDQIASERDVSDRKDPATSHKTFSAVGLARKYCRTFDDLLEASARVPSAFCFVRYEDLVSDPRGEAERIGAFCGLDLSAFDPNSDWARMALTTDQLARRPSYSPLYGRPVSSARVGRFAGRLSAEEVAKVEEISGDLMARFDYPRSQGATARKPAVSDIEYVMIAEAGILERQAAMLLESIRLLPGAAGAATVTIVSPRADRRPSMDSERRFAQHGAEYLPMQIETPCPYYGTSYKLAALATIEKRAGPPKLVMLDSDTLFLAPPTFDLGERGVALRPVDGKGMCSAGPDDPFDEYWHRLASLCGITYDQIPWIETTMEGLRVKASHNGGLVATNRRNGLFTTAYDFLGRTVAAGLFPRPGIGNAEFRTGGGRAREEERQIWGAAQAVVSAAIIALDLEVRMLPPTYNVPVHHFKRLIKRFPQVASEAVHAHYHWLCAADKLAENPLLDGRMKVSKAVRKLLDRHLPLDRPPSLRRRLKRFVTERIQDWRVSAT